VTRVTERVAKLIINHIETHTVLVFVDFSHSCGHLESVEVVVVYQEQVIVYIQ
jgi:hypothetical protein